jgi:hypothetical protein
MLKDLSQETKTQRNYYWDDQNDRVVCYPQKKKLPVSVYISRSANNSLCALSSTPDSKLCAYKHMVSHLKSGMRSGYLDCRSDP